MFNKGVIVLIPFPFTDLSAHKVRPALIISKKNIGDDLIVAFISSQLPERLSPTDIIIKDYDSSFAATGLKISSVIRLDKIATLDKKTALGELGCINKKVEMEVNKNLKILFGL